MTDAEKLERTTYVQGLKALVISKTLVRDDAKAALALAEQSLKTSQTRYDDAWDQFQADLGSGDV